MKIQHLHAAVALVILALSATNVSAHMQLIKTSPEDGVNLSKPPQSITLWFTQEPDIAISKLKLTAPSGELTLGKLHSIDEKSLVAAVADKMTDGAYTVDWTTSGDDGHIQKGAFSFTLKFTE